MNQDKEEIYSNRVQNFISHIEKWQREEMRKVQQKARDEEEYESNKIISDAREKDGEYYAKKQKTIEVDSKIKRSRKVNEMRLSKMKLRF